MTPIQFFQVDAFAEAAFSGNPAAVMPLTEWLPDTTLQAIAAENNLSETAFTVPSGREDADYDLRWFTPTVEVELCGHASLAASHVLIQGDKVRFSTRSGVLTVTREEDLLRLDLPSFSVGKGEIPGLLDVLGLDQGETFIGRGPESTAMVLLSDEAAVRGVKPDFVALKNFHDLVIVTAPGIEQAIASRVFVAPLGIDEDPVTGAAHAALAPFWAERLGRSRFTALQASKRGGLVDCEPRGDRVILGGNCVTVIEGNFQL